MRLSHAYPIVLVLVFAILGTTAYFRWHTSSTDYSSQTIEEATTTVATTSAVVSPSVTQPAATGVISKPAPTPTPQPGTYTSKDVAAHATASSCWTSINGNVYDVTTWIHQHPGGASAILSLCGKDGTAAFNGQHGGQGRPEAELASFKIGILVR